MDKYELTRDLKVFGRQVTTFPAGIKEAFDELIAIVPDANKRAYYGLSRLDDKGGIIYYAAVEETHSGEANVYGLDSYTIQQGEYSTITIKNWMDKIHMIKEAFHELMQDKCADLTTLCVEWYKSDEEVVCMIRK